MRTEILTIFFVARGGRVWLSGLLTFRRLRRRGLLGSLRRARFITLPGIGRVAGGERRQAAEAEQILLEVHWHLARRVTGHVERRQGLRDRAERGGRSLWTRRARWRTQRAVVEGHTSRRRTRGGRRWLRNGGLGGCNDGRRERSDGGRGGGGDLWTRGRSDGRGGRGNEGRSGLSGRGEGRSGLSGRGEGRSGRNEGRGERDGRDQRTRTSLIVQGHLGARVGRAQSLVHAVIRRAL